MLLHKCENFSLNRTLVALAVGTLVSFPAFAVVPVVKTVPWVATNPLVPHTTFAGKAVRVKGTSDVQGANFSYSWDFGDGSPVATGTVTNKYAVEASHTYVSTATHPDGKTHQDDQIT